MPKRKHEQKNSSPKSNPDDPITFTARHPTWAYLELELVSNYPPQSSSATSSSPPPLDALTARTYLTSALNQFLGVSGTSIAIDILKVGTSSATTTSTANSNRTTDTVWIRTPHEDLSALTGAISSWIGSGTPGPSGISPSVAFRVRQRGAWLGSLAGGSGEELFAP